MNSLEELMQPGIATIQMDPFSHREPGCKLVEPETWNALCLRDDHVVALGIFSNLRIDPIGSLKDDVVRESVYSRRLRWNRQGAKHMFA